ncbi:MAG: hypothetical protein KAT68_13110 [Bacteroidales bacterium]|nr:hypothetical protein [Bacteroidales bacterium]
MFISKNKKIINKMGFISDQKGIIDRYFREQQGWNEHIKNTKNFILKSAEIKNKEKVAILGSGWLLDIPIENISKNFKEVYLYDINHPKQIEHKINKYSNVKLITCDITGGVTKQVFNLIKQFKKGKQKVNINDIVYNDFIFSEKMDFVISVNIMNQLDNLIIEYLERFNIFKSVELLQIRKKIQEVHIKSLPLNKSCLITDHEELVLNDKNELEKKNNLIFVDLPKGNFRKKWTWKFDSCKTYIKNKKTYFNVIGIDF